MKDNDAKALIRALQALVMVLGGFVVLFYFVGCLAVSHLGDMSDNLEDIKYQLRKSD